jgi:hypothetical protein
MLSAAVVRIGVNCARFFGIYYFFIGITSIKTLKAQFEFVFQRVNSVHHGDIW